mgnify:CR=1 FL=1
MPETIPVFDGHNDTLTKIRHGGPDAQPSFLERSELGHLDLPRAREGGLAGGFFAIFTSSPDHQRVIGPLLGPDGEVVPGGRSIQLPPPLDRDIARAALVKAPRELLAGQHRCRCILPWLRHHAGKPTPASRPGAQLPARDVGPWRYRAS